MGTRHVPVRATARAVLSTQGQGTDLKIDLAKLIADARGLRPHTKRSYTNAVERWLAFAGADPTGWTPVVAQAFYDQLVAGGLSVATVNNAVIGGLTFVFKRAGQLYNIPNPITAIDRYRAEERDGKRALTAAQANALLATCAGASLVDMRDRAALVLGLYTGMRRMSLVSLDREGVTDHGKYVTLRAFIKGGKWYEVPLDKRGWRLVKPYVDALDNARILPAPPSPLFTALRARITVVGDEIAPGDRLTEDGLYKALSKRADAARVKNFSPHILRHTFVTWCRGEPAKIEPQFIAAITGHEEGRFRNYQMIDTYTDKKSLAGAAARMCYEAIADKLEAM